MAWNDLSERQKSLDRAIEACGMKLDNTSSCLKEVMRRIGADSTEEDFVRSRIALRLRTQQLLSETDSFIERTEKMLDEMKKDDDRWRAIGKKLGFDF